MPLLKKATSLLKANNQHDSRSATILGPDQDIVFMQKALALAQKASMRDEVPIGAVVVNGQGTIIGRGYNQVEQKKCQTAHAEAMAITQATKKVGDWRLDGCFIYVTLEPCSMCMHLIQLSRCAGVVYGASSPLFGYRLDNGPQSPVYKRDDFVVIDNVQAESATFLLQWFFQKKRKKKSG
jgi:tRNA(adenine34) deaminase